MWSGLPGRSVTQLLSGEAVKTDGVTTADRWPSQNNIASQLIL